MEVVAAIGLAASIAGLIKAGTEIYSVLEKYTTHPSASALVKTVRCEIHDFSFALEKLQPIIFGPQPLNPSRASLIDIDRLTVTLTGCVCTFSELEKEVGSLTSSSRGISSIMERRKWPRVEKTLDQLIQRLQGHKSSLTLILTILTCASFTEAKNCHESLVHQVPASLPASKLGLYGLLGSNLGSPNTATDDSYSIVGNDTDSISGDDSASIITVTPRSNRRPFESALFLSRPYRTVSISSSSFISLRSSQRRMPQWSLLSGGTATSVRSLPVSMYTTTGITLAEAPNLSSLSLPIAPKSLYNSKWYNPTSADSISSNPVKLQLVTALLTAARNGRTDDVRKLLDEGAHLEARDNQGATALAEAAVNGHEETVRLLLDRGADKDAKKKDDLTPLHLAAQNGHEEVARLLLNRGADKDAKKKDDWTPLHLAALDGHEEVARLLLDRGADKDAKGKDDWTPLHLAAFDGHEEVARLLLDRGADKDAKKKDDLTPLHLAAQNGHEEVARLLLDRGADKDARNSKGETPSRVAVRNQNKAVVQLLDTGANWWAVHLLGKVTK